MTTKTIERYLKAVENLLKTTLLLNIGGLTMSFAYMGTTKTNIVCVPIYLFTTGIILSLIFACIEFGYFYNARRKEANQTIIESIVKNKLEHSIFIIIVLSAISCIAGLGYAMIALRVVCFP